MNDIASKGALHSGDLGVTTLADGTRVEKDSSYICALGAVDELNSMLGLLASKDLDPSIRREIVAVQFELLDVASELSYPGQTALAASSALRLAQVAESFGDSLPSMSEALLPGGSEAAALCHVARSTCRSVERQLVSLQASDPGAPSVRIAYMNRLSGLLLVLARVLNRQAGVAEVYPSSLSRSGHLALRPR